MTHRRNHYLVYPPNYTPPMKYYMCYSKIQAWKKAKRLGIGAEVSINIHTHSKSHSFWESSEFKPLYFVEDVECPWDTGLLGRDENFVEVISADVVQALDKL